MHCRWRFESLKSRVILSNYEQMLKDHKVPFKPIHSFEFKITEEEQIAATPRIISHKNLTDIALDKQAPNQEMRPPNLQLDVVIPKSVTSRKDNNVTDKDIGTLEKSKDILENEDIKLDVDIPANIEVEKENQAQKDESDANLLTEESFQMTERFSKLKVKMCSPMKPSQRTQITKKAPNENGATSILKQQDPFSQQSLKKVSFSAAENAVHKFKPDLKSNINIEKPPKTDTIVIKDASGQSNIVVKRMVIQKSKQK